MEVEAEVDVEADLPIFASGAADNGCPVDAGSNGDNVAETSQVARRRPGERFEATLRKTFPVWLRTRLRRCWKDTAAQWRWQWRCAMGSGRCSRSRARTCSRC